MPTFSLFRPSHLLSLLVKYTLSILLVMYISRFHIRPFPLLLSYAFLHSPFPISVSAPLHPSFQLNTATAPPRAYFIIFVIRPVATVRPPSRTLKRCPFSSATGWKVSHTISTLSPGMTILLSGSSVPSGQCRAIGSSDFG